MLAAANYVGRLLAAKDISDNGEGLERLGVKMQMEFADREERC